jgi:hypothetical protein
MADCRVKPGNDGDLMAQALVCESRRASGIAFHKQTSHLGITRNFSEIST